MNKPYIDGIFPIPIGHYHIEENFSIPSTSFIKNKGNQTSLDKYVLEKKELAGLKKQLLDIVYNFVEVVYQPDNKNLSCYITQSWLNITNKNDYHHAHNHPNSFLSGVYYYDVGDEDSITFKNTMPRFFCLHSKNYNKFNSGSWEYKVKQNDVVIFPSSLWHSVEPKQDEKERRSLAFNVFLKGEIGNVDSLTQLNL